eukprot:TRINITY_DN624_c1_g1_i1.p1 TRINITY_DN624_c1_g1~~TRINITY_DN624_c1_g1_i1.p1  ORF type:complete len:188 (-),score=71.06 TRINITY_DN624_c1_g1_i1:290-772(-)
MTSDFERGMIKVNLLPAFVKGEVIRGFGRGSKELGCPTANLPIESYAKLLEEIPVGVYFGWASLETTKKVYKMAMSIGWNPYYKNSKKTMEVHIMDNFEEDFYGTELRVIVIGYIRPESDFHSLDALITAIRDDINFANNQLESIENKQFQSNEFLTKWN